MHDNQIYAVTNRPWHLLVVGLVGAGILFSIDLATTGFAPGLVRETGAIEISSALLYAYAAILWLWTRSGQTWRQSWQVPTIMLMMMGREFDLDKKLTSVGILRSDLYLTNMAPILERILGVLVIAFAVTVIVRLVAQNGPSFLKGLRMGAFWAWSLVGAIGFAVVSKAVDGIGRKLAPFGITVDSQMSLAMVILEELLEFGIPVMFIVALISSIRLPADRLSPNVK